MGIPVTLIPGDGIGPSIADATVRVLEASGAPIDWDVQLAGLAALMQHHDPMPEATLDSIRRTRVALKGPLETPIGEGYRSVNVALRTTFDLYANVRPAHVVVRGGRFDKVDIVLVRENTEGLYVGFEHFIKIGDDPRAAAESLALITRAGSERVIRYAFEYARLHDRHKVTLVHKANILKFSQGLFLEVGRQIAAEYEPQGIVFEDKIVDAMAMNLVLRPEQYDVIVTTNLFGDILSDEISGLVGGLGLAPGANIGRHAAIFEAVHGTAPDLAGKDVANPGALIFAACMMLEHLRRWRESEPDSRGTRDHDPQGRAGDPRPGWHGEHRRVHGCRHRGTAGEPDHVMRILHLSDVHFGWPAVPAQADAVEAMAQHEHFDVVAISGDLAQRARAGEFQRAARVSPGHHAAVSARGPAPAVILVPGNHDVAWWFAPFGVGRGERLYEKYRRYIYTGAGAGRTRPGGDAGGAQHGARRALAYPHVGSARRVGGGGPSPVATLAGGLGVRRGAGRRRADRRDASQPAPGGDLEPHSDSSAAYG